jgi:hypothetical protein
MNERRDDWQHGVDENLAGLNAGQRIWEQEIQTIEKTITGLDELLRGDPARETSGILARLEQVERDLSKINAVLFVDPTGKKGLVHEVDVLTSRERTSSERWRFATAVIVAIISLAGLIVTNWTKIEGVFLEHRENAPESPRKKRMPKMRPALDDVGRMEPVGR